VPTPANHSPSSPLEQRKTCLSSRCPYLIRARKPGPSTIVRRIVLKGSRKLPPFLASNGTSSPTPPGPCIHNISPVHRFPLLCLCFCCCRCCFLQALHFVARCRRSFQPYPSISSSLPLNLGPSYCLHSSTVRLLRLHSALARQRWSFIITEAYYSGRATAGTTLHA
jgi:hypothetical protein